jgi:uncharacterized protein (TIGR00369 family)
LVTARQFYQGRSAAQIDSAPAPAIDKRMDEIPANWKDYARKMLGQAPYFATLGAQMLDVGECAVQARMPYAPHLVGDPDTGVIHGGVITTLLDHIGGAAVMGALKSPMPIATLDLRIDYMKPAAPKLDIIAEAECLKVTHEIAFVRGLAHQGDAADPIALCTTTDMLIRAGAPMPFKGA